MGKKKNKDKKTCKPFCFYCDRSFEDEKVLYQHQQAKHFKCEECGKKLGSASGMQTHLLQVHKRQIKSIPNAKPGRDSLEFEIFGMTGVPEDVIRSRQGAEDDDDEPAAKKMKPDDILSLLPGMPGMPGAPLMIPMRLGMPPMLLGQQGLLGFPGAPGAMPGMMMPPMGMPQMPGQPPYPMPYGMPPQPPGFPPAPFPGMGMPPPHMMPPGYPPMGHPMQPPLPPGPPPTQPAFPVAQPAFPAAFAGQPPMPGGGAVSPTTPVAETTPSSSVPAPAAAAAQPQAYLIYDDESMSMEERRAETEKYRFDEATIKAQLDQLDQSIESRLRGL